MLVLSLQFEQFYSENYSGRKLTWIYNFFHGMFGLVATAFVVLRFGMRHVRHINSIVLHQDVN